MKVLSGNRKKYLIQVYRLEKAVDNIRVNSKSINGCKNKCNQNELVEKITSKSKKIQVKISQEK
jgi:hypothetical protein